MMRMASIGTGKAGFGTAFTMVMLVLAAFFGTHPAYFFTNY
jgi:hypothetical protein